MVGLCILSAEARIELGMNEINKEVVKKVCCFKFLV